MLSPRFARLARLARATVLVGLVATSLAVLVPASASAHGFTSTVYADVRADDAQVRATLDLEFDLLVISAARTQDNDALYDDGIAAFLDGSVEGALTPYADDILTYLRDRFTVTDASGTCTPAMAGAITTHVRDEVPYAIVPLAFACDRPTAGLTVRSELFPDDEGYVTGTKTIVDYAIGGASGAAALDKATPAFSTQQTWYERMAEFFVLGAEHLLFGIDHILFLLVLIIGAHRLRDIVLAATAFTLAHSITFLLASTGVVSAPSAIVEPVIALSIAVVAAWYLWTAWRRRRTVDLQPDVEPRRGLDASDWTRLAVVFGFGLIHGIGFAGALGIDEPWSWALLGSLLVFNVGIEAAQLVIIAVAFPLLYLLRRHASRAALWGTATASFAIAVVGMVWFAERIAAG